MAASPLSSRLKQLSQSYEYYASVGSQLAADLNPRDELQLDDADCAIEVLFLLQPVTMQELFEVVKSIKGHSATGWNCIPAQFISQLLLYNINLSIYFSEFPYALKIAIIIPIHI